MQLWIVFEVLMQELARAGYLNWMATSCLRQCNECLVRFRDIAGAALDPKGYRPWRLLCVYTQAYVLSWRLLLQLIFVSTERSRVHGRAGTFVWQARRTREIPRSDLRNPDTGFLSIGMEVKFGTFGDPYESKACYFIYRQGGYALKTKNADKGNTSQFKVAYCFDACDLIFMLALEEIEVQTKNS